MKPLRAYLRPAVALVILIAALAITALHTGQAAPGGAAPVFVTNTGAAEAVPVTYPTTPTVNIGTLPSVAVSSLPAVTGSISVNNMATSPVPVRNVDNPARHAIQLVGLGAFGGNTNSVQIVPGTPTTTGQPPPPFQIPAGKRLVVEHISAVMGVPTGLKPVIVTIDTSQTLASGLPAGVINFLVPTFLGAVNPVFDSYALSQPIRAYADTAPVFTVTLNGSTPAGFSALVNVALQGYLVDCTGACPGP